MVHVIASVRVKTGRRSEFLQILRENVPKVRQETGCIQYIPTVDVKTGLSQQVPDEDIVTVIEEWSSINALRDHLVSPLMDAYRQRVADIVENVSLKVLEGVEISTTNDRESTLREYLDASENFRHFSSIRFAIFTIYLAVMAGLGTVGLKNDPAYQPYIPTIAKIGGLLMTIVFWHYEERAYYLLKHFRTKAEELEVTLNYTQFKEMRKGSIYEPMHFARVLFFLIVLFWAVALKGYI